MTAEMKIHLKSFKIAFYVLYKKLKDSEDKLISKKS